MSLRSPLYTEELADAIAYATEHGNTIVVASGNDRMVSRFVAYPAADPNTLSVSATDVPASGDPTDVSASFANVGPSPGTVNFSEGETSGVEVDIAAPGMAQKQLDSGTTTLSGTSMAAPDVARRGRTPRDGGVDDSRAPSRDRSTGPEPRAGGVRHGLPRYSGSASRTTSQRTSRRTC